MIMKKLLIILIIPFLSFSQIVATEDCNSIPNPGICFAAIQTFYFNQNTLQCEASIWGGCDDGMSLVPFWNLQACQNNCENNSFINENSSSTRPLKVIDIYGRLAKKEGFRLEIYQDGTINKRYVIQSK